MTTSLTATAVVAVHVDLERRELDRVVLAAKDALEPGLETVRRDRGQEPTRP